MGIFFSSSCGSSGDSGSSSPTNRADAAAAPSGVQILEHDEAVLKLKVMRDDMLKYQRKIESVMERERELAKQYLREDRKDRALLLMRRRKMQEKLIAATNDKILNVMSMVDKIESQAMDIKFAHSIEEGTKMLRSLQEQMSLERVEQIMNDAADAMDTADEISRVLGEPLTVADDAAIERELAELERAQTSPAGASPSSAAAAAAAAGAQEDAGAAERAPASPVSSRDVRVDALQVPSSPLPEVAHAEEREEPREAVPA